MQKSASIQPRTSLSKFGGKFNSFFIRLLRWETASEWAERTDFAIATAKRKEDLAQGATMERFEMAQRLGVVERLALLQNVPQLPFRDAALAASFGKSVGDFEAMPVSKAALNVVFDALAESKSGLLKPEVINERRAKWFKSDGGLDDGAIAVSLSKSRSLVLFSWLFFGKGRIYGFAVSAKLRFFLTPRFERTFSNFQIVFITF